MSKELSFTSLATPGSEDILRRLAPILSTAASPTAGRSLRTGVVYEPGAYDSRAGDRSAASAERGNRDCDSLGTFALADDGMVAPVERLKVALRMSSPAVKLLVLAEGEPCRVGEAKS